MLSPSQFLSDMTRRVRRGVYFSFILFHATLAGAQLLPSAPGATDVVFSTVAEGTRMPIVWGMDAAWISQDNVRRGIAFIGKENISVLRVSFQPTEPLVGDSALTSKQKSDLNKRLAVARLLSRPYLVLNSDPADGNVDPYFTSNGKADISHWAKLIDISMRAYQAAGYKVITVSPFNEPDYGWGQGSMADFRAICERLRTDYADRFRDVRISAGNTLNNDRASEWYNYMKPFVDEGCTHQLAGAFRTYADFFREVRNDGNYATADELHNVMEAMVGVEYGMQTGIWWGFDGLARGEFCRASFGDRLAYAENRTDWSAASVYRNRMDNRIEAFLGTSERQANPSTWRFVCTDRAVYFDGYGPTHEFFIEMPGGNGYEKGQTNAERVINVSWGDDVPPHPIDGTYMIVNRNSRMVMSLLNNSTASGTNVVQTSWSNRKSQHWEVRPVSARVGGDFSYYTICAAANHMPIDVWNWSLDNGGDVRLYDGSLGTNEQWYLQYAGEGYYYIRSRHSNLCLEVANGSKTSGGNVQQGTFAADPRQQWRIIPTTARCKLTPPSAPEGLAATSQRASVRLSWRANTENDIAGYHVLRADENGGEWNTIARLVADTVFIDHDVLPARVYIYKVRAVDESDNMSVASDSVAAAVDGTSGLIARYEMDATLRDTTANRFHAAAWGDEKYTNSDRYVASGSHSLRLDGSNFVQLPATLASPDDWTVSLWIYWTGGSAGAGQRIFEFGNDPDNCLFLTPSDGSHMRFAFVSGGEEQCLLAPKLAALKMKHVALTVSADSVTLYVDGSRVAATADILLRSSSVRPVLGYIGRTVDSRRAASVPLLKAYLDDVRFFNRALSPDEVAQVMADVDTGVIPSPLLQEGTGEAFTVGGQPIEDISSARGILIRGGKKIFVR